MDESPESILRGLLLGNRTVSEALATVNGRPLPGLGPDIRDAAKALSEEGKSVDPAEIYGYLVNVRGFDRQVVARELGQYTVSLSEVSKPQASFDTHDFIRSTLTELRNARVLQELHGDNLRHTRDRGWLTWDGARWAPDRKAASRYAHAVGQHWREQAKDFPEPQIAKLFLAHAKQSESSRGIDATLKVASSLEGIAAESIAFDAHAWLFNCANGTVDLRTGTLLPHRREDFITKVSPIPYVPGASCPTWERHLSQVFGGDEELIAYFQWACGYSLTGDTRHQIFFICHGPRATGKSTTLRVLERVLGPDFALALDPEALMAQRSARHSCDLAQLRGVRFTTTLETGEGRRVNEPLVKALTGGDSISARKMRQDPCPFTPELKLWIATNHVPVARDDSGGFFRRVRLIPFLVEMKDTDRLPNIGEELMKEREGILAWAVRGATGAEIEPRLPSAVRHANEQYQHESDDISRFFADCCNLGEGNQVTKAELYAAFCAWSGSDAVSSKAFAQRLKQRAISERRTGKTRYWEGISLKSKPST